MNVNDPYNVPDDGAWHTIFQIKSLGGWCEVSVEAGTLRIGVVNTDIDPNTGHLLATGERWTAPHNCSGFVKAKAETGAAGAGVVTGRE